MRFKLDDALAEAHAAMGVIQLIYDWDGPAAEREVMRAIQLNPSLAAACIRHAGYFPAVGKQAEAVPEIRQAFQFDPVSLRMHALGADGRTRCSIAEFSHIRYRRFVFSSQTNECKGL